MAEHETLWQTAINIPGADSVGNLYTNKPIDPDQPYCIESEEFDNFLKAILPCVTSVYPESCNLDLGADRSEAGVMARAVRDERGAVAHPVLVHATTP